MSTHKKTSSLKNHRINSRVSTHTKKLSRNSITKRRIGAQFATAQSKPKPKHMCSTTSSICIDCATGTMHAVYLCIISWLRSGQLEAEMRAHISPFARGHVKPRPVRLVPSTHKMSVILYRVSVRNDAQTCVSLD